MGGEETLIQSLSAALKVYDEALESCYKQSLALVNAGKKGWTEEQCKVLARQKVREAGFDLPEIYRWRIKALVGGVHEMET